MQAFKVPFVRNDLNRESAEARKQKLPTPPALLKANRDAALIERAPSICQVKQHPQGLFLAELGLMPQPSGLCH